MTELNALYILAVKIKESNLLRNATGRAANTQKLQNVKEGLVQEADHLNNSARGENIIKCEERVNRTWTL